MKDKCSVGGGKVGGVGGASKKEKKGMEQKVGGGGGVGSVEVEEKMRERD